MNHNTSAVGRQVAGLSRRARLSCDQGPSRVTGWAHVPRRQCADRAGCLLRCADRILGLARRARRGRRRCEAWRSPCCRPTSWPVRASSAPSRSTSITARASRCGSCSRTVRSLRNSSRRTTGRHLASSTDDSSERPASSCQANCRADPSLSAHGGPPESSPQGPAGPHSSSRRGRARAPAPRPPSEPLPRATRRSARELPCDRSTKRRAPTCGWATVVRRRDRSLGGWLSGGRRVRLQPRPGWR